MEKRPAVFLDRDGVINPLIYHRDHGIVDSPFTLEQFSVLPEVPRAIRLFNDLGFAVVIASNQPGVAKGHFEPELLEQIDSRLDEALAACGARVDAVFYCLHHPEAVRSLLRCDCPCRKPGIGMLTLAAEKLGLSLAESYLIGDGLTDLEAGSRAGCRTIFIGRWKSEYARFIQPSDLVPDLVAANLWESAQLIETELRDHVHSRSGVAV